MQRLKGQDHKIRVMTTPDPTGIGAKWLELKRTPKDIEMRDLIDDLRRAVYRVFGVMPVEMGLTDGMPRSTANAQLDVSSSHLVTPMLELISSKSWVYCPSLVVMLQQWKLQGCQHQFKTWVRLNHWKILF